MSGSVSDLNLMNQINQELVLQEEVYIKTRPIRIFCGTFNVNGKSPDESLRPWLCASISSSSSGSDRPIDLFAIGFQELVDLNASNAIFQADANERELLWINLLNREMADESNFKWAAAKYKLVTRVRMFGLFLIVYAREALLAEQEQEQESCCIQDVRTSSVAMGIMEMIGNKGSVGVSLRVNQSRVCFVCSHFAADTDKLEKRNSDFRSTRQRLRFQLQQDAQNDFYDIENDHDAVFWFGDLNYRLDNLGLREAFQMIYANEFEELLKFDQLSLQRAKSRVFDNYIEGKINFRPTYKYLVKSDVYEKHEAFVNTSAASANNFPKRNSFNSESNSILSNEELEQQQPVVKVKLPSWTDRCLYKSNLKCEQLQYSCVNTITVSDHKPVYSTFELHVKMIDYKKRQDLFNELVRRTDRKFNEELPRISIESFELNFGHCMYYDAKSVDLIIKNSGVTRSNVDLFFYDNKLQNTTSTTGSAASHSEQQWVSLRPVHKAKLEPGATYTVEVTTTFGHCVLERLNKTRKLDDFLIVRCLNGNDLFVTLNCSYKPTIIGISLKALTTLGGCGAEVSFEACDQTELIEVVESRIELFEKSVNARFREQLILSSAHFQKERLARELKTKPGGADTNTHFTMYSNLDIFNRTFQSIKKELVDEDEFFLNALSPEYKFLMQHLINRCTSRLENSLKEIENEQERSTSAPEEEQEGQAMSDLKTDDQKNLALYYLSNRNFEDFEEAHFDMECLAELLNDLLYALPQPLMPARFIDFYIYSEHDYEACLPLMIYLARSHVTLFEMIVKFLQVYRRCLSTCSSNFTDVLAEAIFQTSKSGHVKNRTENIQAQTVCRFLKLFIDNHAKFLMITG